MPTAKDWMALAEKTQAIYYRIHLELAREPLVTAKELRFPRKMFYMFVLQCWARF